MLGTKGPGQEVEDPAISMPSLRREAEQNEEDQRVERVDPLVPAQQEPIPYRRGPLALRDRTRPPLRMDVRPALVKLEVAAIEDVDDEQDDDDGEGDQDIETAECEHAVEVALAEPLVGPGAVEVLVHLPAVSIEGVNNPCCSRAGKDHRLQSTVE